MSISGVGQQLGRINGPHKRPPSKATPRVYRDRPRKEAEGELEEERHDEEKKPRRRPKKPALLHREAETLHGETKASLLARSFGSISGFVPLLSSLLFKRLFPSLISFVSF